MKRKYVYNWTAEDLAAEYEVSIRTVFRRTEKLIDKIYETTTRKNWSLNFICLQVKDESWLCERFNKFAKDSMLYVSIDELKNSQSSQVLQ